jgi:hypothetical protein
VVGYVAASLLGAVALLDAAASHGPTAPPTANGPVMLNLS